MSICFKNKIIAYPVRYDSTNFHLIKIENNGKPTTYQKILKTPKEVNEALTKTYLFLAKKLGY